MNPSTYRLGRASIKESMDNLPAGVCFARPNGMIALCNHCMDRLFFQLSGSDLQHLFELHHALKEPRPEIEILDAEHFIYRFPDNQIWQFSQQQITDESGIPYTQVYAADITLLYEKRRELQQENHLLHEANVRATKLYAELDQLVRDEESFAIKTRVHDEVGLALLKSRQLLKKDASLQELRRIGGEWNRIVGTLGTSQEPAFPSSIAEEWADLEALLKGIGVSLQRQGALPRTRAAANLLSAATRECAINTVRHGEGNALTVYLSHSGGNLTAHISNNGKIPKQPIVEGGGLGALRKRIEGANGTMTVLCCPDFTLKITLPDEEVSP